MKLLVWKGLGCLRFVSFFMERSFGKVSGRGGITVYTLEDFVFRGCVFLRFEYFELGGYF